MADRIIELHWICSECDRQGILGRHKQCPHCGAPREKGEMQMSGIDADGSSRLPSVHDPELLALAAAGPDWFCDHCGSGNRGDSTSCSGCGGRLTSNVPSPVTIRNTRLVRRFFGALLALAVACSGGMWWAFQTHEVTAEVTQLRWTHTTVREVWTPTTRADWKDGLIRSPGRAPVNGEGERAEVDITTCREKKHHDETYACGTDRVCRPKTRTESYTCGEVCTDNGNGFATCSPKTCSRSVPDGETCSDKTRYCQRPVMKTWCDYNTHVWVRDTDAVASGEGYETSWKELSTGPLDRIVRRGDYVVELLVHERRRSFTHELLLHDEATYASWQLGETATVEVGRRGGVHSVRRATDPQ